MSNRLSFERLEKPMPQFPWVMGVLNLNNDSFYSNSRIESDAALLARANAFIADGASILDIGAESTRPGADSLPEAIELPRVVSAIRLLRANGIEALISVDTQKPAVMKAAIAAGADMINDVNGLQAPGALETIADLGCPVCIMHRQGDAKTMQDNPQYDNVVEAVITFFKERIAAAEAAGIDPHQIILDVGIGFGKNLSHNLALLRAHHTMRQLGCPLLLGVSRKSFFQALLGRPVTQRLPGSLAIVQHLLQQKCVDIIRVHDVAETIDMIRIHQYLSTTSDPVMPGVTEGVDL